MIEIARIALYSLGVVSGIAIGAGIAGWMERRGRPAITVCRCPECRAAGPHVDAAALHYDESGSVDVISFCCEHTARELWESEEREPPDDRTIWWWPKRINGFEKR